MELWTAFIIGLAGSLHCVGMCGPIAMALPVKQGSNWWQLLGGRLLYNFGRITTYALMGILFGAFGKGLALAGMQQAVSISLGVLLLLMALFYYRSEQLINKLSGAGKWSAWLRGKLAHYLKLGDNRSLYTIGLLNGLLPCGFVYFGIVGAISTGNILLGSAYMALFGLGTLPLMQVMAMAGSAVNVKARLFMRKLAPAVVVVFACLFILRGLNLGIPYVSPKINTGHGIEHAKCH